MKKNIPAPMAKKALTFLTAAAVTLSGICVQPALLEHAYASAQDMEETEKRFVLDPITLETPALLSEITLPESVYGIYSWEDDTFIASKASEEFTVWLTPEEDTDVSWMDGWDAETGRVKCVITICILNAVTETETETTTTNVNVLDETMTEPLASESSEADAISDDEHPGTPGSIEDSQDPPSGEFSTVTSDGSSSPETPSEEKEEMNIFDAEGDNAEAGEIIPETDPDQPAEADWEADAAESEAVPEESNTEMDESDLEKTSTADDDVLTVESSGESMTEAEMTQYGLENHTSGGITVTGADLPWYVQLRVSDAEDSEFYTISNAEIFRAYNFALWDLQTDTEYQIPEGSYVSFCIPVRAGYDYRVEHILHNGAHESIVPTLDGTTLIFSTGSLSSFGIAGSQTIVGDGGLEENYPSTVPTQTPAPTQTSTPTAAPSIAPSTSGSGTGSNSGQRQNTSEKSNSGSRQAGITTTNGSRAVATGDETTVFSWILTAGIALLISGILSCRIRKQK